MKLKKYSVLGLLTTVVVFSSGCASSKKNDENSNPDVAAAGEYSEHEANRTLASPFNMKPGLKYLKGLNSDELAALYKTGIVAEIPVGEGQGFPLITPKFHPFNYFANLLWGGKVFDPATQTLRNNLLYLTKRVDAKVYKGNMKDILNLGVGQTLAAEIGKTKYEIDGKPSIILDYKDSSSAWARGIIDEIRQVKTAEYKNLYLGRATLNGRFFCYFALQFE